MKVTLFEKYGPWALITGSTGGIGSEFANQLAQQGFNLVLVSRDPQKLEKQQTQIQENNSVDVRYIFTDLSQNESITAIAEGTKDLEIGLLVNNAGFALTGRFLEMPVEKSLDLLGVNCNAPILLMHHFGKRMSSSKKGGIINVASATAFLPIPFWSMYSASKVMLLHLSEALGHEFKRDNVDVLGLCPGNTKTGFSEKAGADMQDGGPVDQVVKEALRYLGKKPSHTVGGMNKFAQFVINLLSRKARIALGSKIIGDTE